MCSSSISKSNDKNKKRSVRKITPADAKRTQQSLLRQRKKQICGSNNKSKSKLGELLDAEREERKFLMDSRKTKMDFELNKHQELKQLEINKQKDMREIENKKLDLQKKIYEVDVEEKELKKEHLRAQTEIEKNNLLLVKMKVLEKQIEMRNKNNTEMNDKLDDMFNKTNK